MEIFLYRLENRLEKKSEKCYMIATFQCFNRNKCFKRNSYDFDDLQCDWLQQNCRCFHRNGCVQKFYKFQRFHR